MRVHRGLPSIELLFPLVVVAVLLTVLLVWRQLSKWGRKSLSRSHRVRSNICLRKMCNNGGTPHGGVPPLAVAVHGVLLDSTPDSLDSTWRP